MTNHAPDQTTRREIEMIAAHRPMLEAATRYVVNVGARGTGKSYTACGQVAPLLMLQRKGRGVMARKVKDTCRNSVWAEFKNGLSNMGILNKFRINNTMMSAEAPNGSVISCIGFDDPEKIKSLQGVSWAIIEEADACTWADVETLDFSMRQGNDKLILLANPPATVPGQRHWLQERFLDRDRPDVTKIKAFYWDNPFLPEAYIQNLKDLEHTNPKLYKRWVLGEFTTLDGAIYTNWEVLTEIPDGADFLGYGLDFGFANDPAALVAVYKWQGGYLLDELFYKTSHTANDLVNVFGNMGIEKRRQIVADSANPESIETIRRAGYWVDPVNKGKNKMDNIQVMQGVKLHVTERSTNLITELSSYTYKTDKQLNFKPQPIDSFDHLLDASLYFIITNHRNRTTKLTFTL